MRKCPACGYLVLGDGDVCKHCGGALLRVAPEPLVTSGAPIAAPPVAAPLGTLPLPPIPPAPPPAPRFGPSVAPPPPLVPTVLPYDPSMAAPNGREAVARDYWNAQSTPAPPKRTRNSARTVLAMICALSMALGWVAVNHLFDPNRLPAGTSAFVAGHGVAYSSPDHTFDARFPSTPAVEQRQVPVASSTATISLAHVETDDYEVMVGSMVLPVAIPAAEVSSALRTILGAAVSAEGVKEVTEKDITHYGVPGVEMRAKVDDGYDARFTMLISGTHVYMLGAHAKTGTDRLYDALVASLVMY